MRRFVGQISTSKVGSETEFEFEVPDDATETEIETAAKEAAFDYIDWFYTESKETE